MSRLHAEAEAMIKAAPADIYGTLADYHHGHPQILPKPYFTRLEVDQGGAGAGTIFRVYMQNFGRERMMRMQVAEPEPGRVLTETDLETGMKTTFTVTPVEEGRSALVKIETDWEASGWFDRFLLPRLMVYVYRKELNQLARYLETKTKSAAG